MAVGKTPDGRHFVYWLDKSKGKSKQRKYFGRGPGARAQAEAWDRQRQLKKKTKAPTSGPTFEDLAAVYVKGKNFSPNSEKCLLYRMGNFMPVFGHRKAMRVSQEDLASYVQKRRKDGVKDATIRREGNDIKAIFSHGAKRQPPLIPFDPVKDFQFPKEDNAAIIPPTEEEGRRIYQAAQPHLRRFIQLSWFLGIRPGPVELLSITWDQVNWERRRVRIISAKKGGPSIRDVPIKPQFLTILRNWYEADKKDLPLLVKRDKAHQNRKTAFKYAPVTADVELLHVVHYKGHRIKYSIQTAWAGALKSAGIARRIRPYDLRHHFATEALESGGDLKALSQVMGSAPKTLVQHYQHVTDALAEKTVDLIKDVNFGTEAPQPEKDKAPKEAPNVINLAKLRKKRALGS